MSRVWRAAVYGSQYDNWKRKNALSMIWIPRKWDDVRPPSVSSLRRVLDDSGIRKSPMRWRTLANMGGVKGFEEYFDKKTHKHGPGCACWKAYQGARVRDLGERAPVNRSTLVSGSTPVQDIGEAVLKEHRPEIHFDQDTWITTITEVAVFDLNPLKEVADQRVAQAFDAASPENWAEAGNLAEEDRFFVESIPLERVDGHLTPLRNPTNRPFEEGATHLREVTKWEWNFGSRSRAGAEIVLNINAYKRETLKARDGTESPSHFSFKYSLQRCLAYDLGPVTFADILDVDDGGYTANYDSETKILDIEAIKRIHFCPPRPGDEDEVALLNLLAPAVTSMLLRGLVIDGTARALRERSES